MAGLEAHLRAGHALGPSDPEAEAGQLCEFQGQPGLPTEFQAG